MYAYLKGLVTDVTATYICVEVYGVGYLVKVPNPYSFVLNENITVYLHQHVREDAIELYGFHSKVEKEVFEKLISVKGLGPKGALAILASTTSDEISLAVSNANASFFSKFPGIGQKLSQQIILDLKGKLAFVDNSYVQDPRLDEVTEGLKALGYSSADINKAIKNLKLEKDTTVSDAFKQALKLLKK